MFKFDLSGINPEKILLDKISKYAEYFDTASRDILISKLDKLGLTKFYDLYFTDFLAEGKQSRARLVHCASWNIIKRFKTLSTDDYLEEKRILNIMCSFLEPMNPDRRFFKEQILPYMDGRGYVQLYRGVCRGELEQALSGNYDALGIWWTTEIRTACNFSEWSPLLPQGEKGGHVVLSWRVNVGMLKDTFAPAHRGEVHISPMQVHNSCQCDKLEVLSGKQAKKLLQKNKELYDYLDRHPEKCSRSWVVYMLEHALKATRPGVNKSQ